MEALDLDFLDQEHIQLNNIDPVSQEWIPPDGERGRRVTELYCIACKKHLERSTMMTHIDSARHRNWIEWNNEEKKATEAAKNRMSASFPPPGPAPTQSTRTGPPPTKIPKRDPTIPIPVNNLPTLPRNRLQLGSKAGPATCRIKEPRVVNESTKAPELQPINFVKEGQHLEAINLKVQDTLRAIPMVFPPKPPSPAKLDTVHDEEATSSNSTVVIRPKPPQPPAPWFMTERDNSNHTPSHNIIIAPQFHSPNWPQPSWNNQGEQGHWPMNLNAGIDSRIISSQNLSSHIVYNQQGRPMLLLPL